MKNGFLKAGILSLLLHNLLIALLLGLGTGSSLTEVGPTVYRVALHSLASPKKIIEEAELGRQANQTPLLAKAQMREGEELTRDLKKHEEPFLHNKDQEKEVSSLMIPPVLAKTFPEEPEQIAHHQPVAMPRPVPETGPDFKEGGDPGLSGGLDGDMPARTGSDERPSPGEGGSGSGLGPAEGKGTELGVAGHDKLRNGAGEGYGYGRPGWRGAGRQVGVGNGTPGSNSGSGKEAGGEKGGYAWSASGSRSGGTALPSPRVDRNPKPVYPLEARDKGYHGQVLLRVEVLSDGLVGQIEIKRSSGYAMLDQSAYSAVKRWKFVPAKQEGVPVTSWVNIPIKYELF